MILQTLNTDFCIRYPKLIGIISENSSNIHYVPDLDDICNCGRKYREHKEWENESDRQERIKKGE